jgi:hypothetical protein
MANAGCQHLSNLGHCPLELAGMTIPLAKTLIRKDLAEHFGYDRHHAQNRQDQQQTRRPSHRRAQE